MHNVFPPFLYPICFEIINCVASLHCLFCHGFEERGCASVGVLAVGDIGNVVAAMRVARMARRFADSVTIYTHGAEGLSQMLEDAAEGTGIKVDKRPISRFVKGASKSEVQIVFEDGMISTEGFLVSSISMVYKPLVANASSRTNLKPRLTGPSQTS